MKVYSPWFYKPFTKTLDTTNSRYSELFTVPAEGLIIELLLYIINELLFLRHFTTEEDRVFRSIYLSIILLSGIDETEK